MAEAPQLPKGHDRAGARRRSTGSGWRAVAIDPGGGLGHAAEERNREQHPPDRDVCQREAGRGRRVRKRRTATVLDHEQVDRQQDAVVQIARSHSRWTTRDRALPSPTRCGSSDSYKESNAAGHADVADDEQRQRQPSVTVEDREHARRRQALIATNTASSSP